MGIVLVQKVCHEDGWQCDRHGLINQSKQAVGNVNEADEIVGCEGRHCGIDDLRDEVESESA